VRRVVFWEDRGMDRLVLVHSAPSAAEGHLIRGRLESEGIPVLTKGEGDGPYRLGPMYLFVTEEVEVQARLVLAEILQGGMAISEEEDLHLEDGAGVGPPEDEDADR
jgi:hypothetical protein